MTTYSGPYIRNTDTPSSSSARQQYVYKSNQRKESLPYYLDRTTANCPWAKQYLQSTGVTSGSQSVLSSYAQAYDRFHSKAGEKAQNLMNLMEARKSMDMIAKRTIQLLNLAKAVRRLELQKALSIVGVTTTGKHRTSAKDPASLWLELTFGWLPMINDIGTSVNVLQRDFPSTLVRGKGKSTDSGYAWYQSDWWGDWTAIVSHRLQASIRVDNPNILLANQLGFLNPAAVLWDAVPFSFVVDWFIPVSKFLNSFSNEFGITLLNPVRSIRIDLTGKFSQPFYLPTLGGGNYVRINRQLSGFPTPSLWSRAHLPSPSLWLAATSTSLLVQQLSGIAKSSKRPQSAQKRTPDFIWREPFYN